MSISVLLLTLQPIKMPTSGGAVRARALYDTHCALGANVRHISLYYPEFFPRHTRGQYAIAVPFGASRLYHGKPHHFSSTYLASRYAVTDGYPYFKKYLPKKVDIIQIEHPWLINVALRLLQEPACANAKLVYSAHNIETPLFEQIFIREKIKDYHSLLNDMKDLEDAAFAHADFIIAVSQADKNILSQLSPAKILIAPNGISRGDTTPQKIMYWQKHLPTVPWALFIGSWYSPNIQGFTHCLGDALAYIPPFSKIVIAGDACSPIADYYQKNFWHSINLPRLQFLHKLPDADLNAVKALANIYLLPITYGGGTNIKTAEAIYSGKPIIGTSCSFKGYEDYLHLPGIHIADDEHTFKYTLKTLLTQKQEMMETPEHTLLRQQVLWETTLTPAIQTIHQSIKASL